MFNNTKSVITEEKMLSRVFNITLIYSVITIFVTWNFTYNWSYKVIGITALILGYLVKKKNKSASFLLFALFVFQMTIFLINSLVSIVNPSKYGLFLDLIRIVINLIIYFFLCRYFYRAFMILKRRGT